MANWAATGLTVPKVRFAHRNETTVSLPPNKKPAAIARKRVVIATGGKSIHKYCRFAAGTRNRDPVSDDGAVGIDLVAFRSGSGGPAVRERDGGTDAKIGSVRRIRRYDLPFRSRSPLHRGFAPVLISCRRIKIAAVPGFRSRRQRALIRCDRILTGSGPGPLSEEPPPHASET
jgi:hypothetical protein